MLSKLIALIIVNAIKDVGKSAGQTSPTEKLILGSMYLAAYVISVIAIIIGLICQAYEKLT